MEYILKRIRKLNIIEGLILSFICGWVFTSLVCKSADNISNLEFVTTISISKLASYMIAFIVASFALYILEQSALRLLMFLSVFLYSALCCYNSASIEWGSRYNNYDGKVYFTAIMCLLSVLAFIYVRDDIFFIVSKLNIGRKSFIAISVSAGILLFAFISLLGIYRYYSFSNSTFDFGIFTQMYEHMAKYFTPITTLERNYSLSHFAVHFSPVYYIALPVYYLFRHPVNVDLIEALMLALPVFPIILLSKHFNFSRKLTLGIILLYIVYPVTSCGAEYDMHENCFLIFMILMTLYAIESNRHLMFVIFMFLTMSVKEDAPIYILTIGLFMLLSNKAKIRGIIMLITGGSYFIIVTAIMEAHGLGIMDNRFKNLYYDADGSLLQIVRTLITNPVYVISQFINESPNSSTKISFMICVFLPLILILISCGRKFSRDVLLVPLVLINLIPTYPYMHNICYQYGFGPMALLFYIVILNINDLKEIDYRKTKSQISIGIICGILLFSSQVFPYLTKYYNKYEADKASYHQMESVLNSIPEDASVSASGFLTPHLSSHTTVYDQSHTELDVIRDTDYLAIDLRSKPEQDKFKSLLDTDKYVLVKKIDKKIAIYKKK